MGLSRILALPVILVCASQAPAQSRLEADFSQRLIKLDVAAVDAKGAPVTDLRAADIQVREDGKPHPVVFFRFSGSRRPIAPAGPGEFLNRPAPPATVILLDRWNERLMTMAAAWQDVSAAVAHMETLDRVYLYILTNRGDVVPVYPLPPADADLHAAPPPTSEDLVARLNDAVRTLTGLRDVETLDPLQRADTTMMALGLFSKMASIAGRKNLIWVTHGFPLQVTGLTGNWVDYTQQVQNLAQMAARAQVAFYTVDQSAEGAGADVAGLSQMTLETFAGVSGGRWYASGRTKDAIAGALTDARGSYQLAYYSSARETGWKERKIRVDAVRKGVHLQTREGYFGDEGTPDPEQMAENAFDRESHSPFEATEIPLRVIMSRKPAGVHFDIHIDPADVLIEHRGQRFQGGLTVAFGFYRGGIFQGPGPTIQKDLDYSQEQFNQVSKDGIVIPQDVSVSGQTEQVRVMVFDRRLQSLGSVTIPIG
jgi:VWFA-related protein